MNNYNSQGSVPSGADQSQSALSLLVNAVDNQQSHGQSQEQSGRGSADSLAGQRSLVDTLRLRGLAGDAGASLEEHLLLQQQQQAQQAGFGGSNGASGSLGLLSQLRDQQILSQLGQQQQLASLLGGAPGGALAAQMRLQQAQQSGGLSHADILALSRSGGLPGLSGALGGLGGASGSALQSELESLQRLEELERSQRLLAAAQPIAATRDQQPRQPSLLQLQSMRQDSLASSAAEQPQKQRVTADASSVSSSPRMKPTNPATSSNGGGGPLREIPPGGPEACMEVDNEDLEKAPGSVIVPCRARGMPMDHNFKTAYFVIPENVKHGEELICSYFACRNAGIKFRYCSHCKVPVAKRNFRKRHKHGGEQFPRRSADDSGEEDTIPSTLVKKRGIPSQITAKREESVEADGISSQSGDSTSSEKEQEPAAKQGTVPSFKKMIGMNNVSGIPHANPKINEERHQRWLSLLGKRPSTKDGELMSSWLMEVLAVSDLETPLKPVEDSNGSNSNLVSVESLRSKKPPLLDSGSKKKIKKSRPLPSQASKTSSAGGYGSPGEDSGGASGQSSNNKKGPSVMGKLPMGSPRTTFGSGDAGIVKKRSSDLLGVGRQEPPVPSGSPSSSTEPPDSSFVSGSFAEWKERKRQKNQLKAGGKISE